METFKKRQKEQKRLEKQRDKAAKRQEIKARKAAGIVEPEPQDDNPETTPENTTPAGLIAPHSV